MGQRPATKQLHRKIKSCRSGNTFISSINAAGCLLPAHDCEQLCFPFMVHSHWELVAPLRCYPDSQWNEYSISPPSHCSSPKQVFTYCLMFYCSQCFVKRWILYSVKTVMVYSDTAWFAKTILMDVDHVVTASAPYLSWARRSRFRSLWWSTCTVLAVSFDCLYSFWANMQGATLRSTATHMNCVYRPACCKHFFFWPWFFIQDG